MNWITNTIFPPELQTWFLGTVSSPGNQADSTQIYQSLYRGMAAPALMIAAVAAAGRIIRALADHRTGAMDTTLSVIPRFLLAVAVIGVPGTSAGFGYTAIVWAINASVAVAGAVVGMILNTSFLSTMKPGEGWFSHVLAVLAATSHDMVAVVLGGIPLLILVLYAAFLMVVRTVMLGFCVVTAPLCFATAVFDSNNRFFHWWLDLLGSVLLTPLVLGIAIALSLTLASHVASSLVVGPLLAMVVMGGGLWFAGKMIHQLTWRGFSHGSALAGFAAGVATMVAPVHRISSIGFMAEALGANRGGGNSAVNFMKRMGLAAQGLSPSAAGSHSFGGGLGGAGLSDVASDLMASNGPPDVAGALGPDGRAAVAGSEALFSQQAFNAFGAEHAATIGSTTRDQPYGSVTSGDRAKLAWERTSTGSQATFADDFLSSWLGSSSNTSATLKPRSVSGLSPLEAALA